MIAHGFELLHTHIARRDRTSIYAPVREAIASLSSSPHLRRRPDRPRQADSLRRQGASARRCGSAFACFLPMPLCSGRRYPSAPTLVQLLVKLQARDVAGHTSERSGDDAAPHTFDWQRQLCLLLVERLGVD